MRITIDSTAMPTEAHITCWVTNKYGCWKRSSATSAEALYTMTTLAQTSASVARNSHLSDGSFRAILPPPPQSAADEPKVSRRRLDTWVARRSSQ